MTPIRRYQPLHGERLLIDTPIFSATSFFFFWSPPPYPPCSFAFSLSSMERSVSPESDPDAPFHVSNSLAPPRVNKSAGTTTTTFDGLLREPLLLKEDLKDGCGGQLWPAGMVLAKYLLCRHSSTLSDKTMLVVPGITGGLSSSPP